MTGSRGLVGTALLPVLRSAEYSVAEFDLAMGGDVLDRPGLDAALTGCEAVVHLAALTEVDPHDPDRLTRVNVEGTKNVLEASAAVGVARVVFMSSAAVLGVFKGHRAPDYLPLDDAHPLYPSDLYAMSKARAEALCAEFGRWPGLSVLALRPPGVWTDETYAWVDQMRDSDPDFEWKPYWEYGAFIDARDLAHACLAAIDAPCESFEALLVAAPDITTAGPTAREWVARLHPSTEWRGGTSWDARPYRSLIRTDRAATVLGWRPQYTWAGYREDRLGKRSGPRS